MNNEPKNPLDIPLIVDLICQLLNPPALLNCREVNHCWNELATRQLLAKGWTVNLNSTERIHKYWQLLQVVAVEMRNNSKVSGPVPVNLHLAHITKAPPDPDNKIEKMLRQHGTPCRHGIKSIISKLISSGIGPKFWRFLQYPTNNTTLTQIGFYLIYDSSPPPPTAAPQVETAADDKTDLDLKLSRLKTLALDFFAPPRAQAQIRPGRAQVESLQTLLAAAPNLESIRCTRRVPSTQDASPFFLLQRDDPNSTPATPTWAQNLIELELVLQEMFHVPHLRLRLHTFPNLRVLKISTPDLGEGAPIQLAVEFRQLGLLQLIRDNCPSLESLEITEIDDSDGPQFQQVPPGNEDELELLRLPQLIHYGYRMKRFHGNGAMPDVALTSALCMLYTMNRLQNLRTVITNLEACIALTRVYGQRSVEPGIRFPTWANVIKLTIDVSHSSLPPVPYVGPRLEDIVRILKRIFPSLEELILNLGADRVTWKVTSNFQYVLQIVFGLESLRRVEINNYYNGWTLPEVPTIPCEARADVEEELPSPPARLLEMLAIRGVRPFFSNRHVDTTTFPPPRLDILRLQELIPTAVRSRLTLEVDGDLLWNSGLYSSYTELIQTVGSLQGLRVRLM